MFLFIIFQIGNLHVGHLCELSTQRKERRRGQGTAANHYLVAVPCPSLRSCGWAESSLTQYRKIEVPFVWIYKLLPDTWNWDCCRSFSFWGKYVSNFKYSVGWWRDFILLWTLHTLACMEIRREILTTGDSKEKLFWLLQNFK